MIRPARVAVVLNGRAGALLEKSGSADLLQQALREAGLDAEFIGPDAGTLPKRIRLAAQSGADAVLVAGGDGTVACAAEVLMGGNVPLGILPFGTMNLLAKDLALPVGDLPAAMRAVAAGKVRMIDVGEVNGTFFLCASMLGMPVKLGRTREQTRGGGVRLWSRMAQSALRLLRQERRPRLTLGVDGMTRRVRPASLTVTVNPLDDGCGRVFGRSALDGGRLGVYLVEELGLSDVLRLVLRMAIGRWRHDRAIREYHALVVEIGSRGRSLQVMNDGEFRTIKPPLRYVVHPGALRVLAP